jgi:uncharacterized membrane protein YdjX (TVP38/TMEM64 family)
MLGTLIGNTPGAAINSFLGSLAENLLDINGISGPCKTMSNTKSVGKWFILCLGIFSSVLIFIAISRIARQSLNQALEEEMSHEKEEKPKETDAFMIEQ